MWSPLGLDVQMIIARNKIWIKFEIQYTGQNSNLGSVWEGEILTSRPPVLSWKLRIVNLDSKAPFLTYWGISFILKPFFSDLWKLSMVMIKFTSERKFETFWCLSLNNISRCEESICSSWRIAFKTTIENELFVTRIRTTVRKYGTCIFLEEWSVETKARSEEI